MPQNPGRQAAAEMRARRAGAAPTQQRSAALDAFVREGAQRAPEGWNVGGLEALQEPTTMAHMYYDAIKQAADKGDPAAGQELEQLRSRMKPTHGGLSDLLSGLMGGATLSAPDWATRSPKSRMPTQEESGLYQIGHFAGSMVPFTAASRVPIPGLGIGLGMGAITAGQVGGELAQAEREKAAVRQALEGTGQPIPADFQPSSIQSQVGKAAGLGAGIGGAAFLGANLLNPSLRTLITKGALAPQAGARTLPAALRFTGRRAVSGAANLGPPTAGGALMSRAIFGPTPEGQEVSLPEQILGGAAKNPFSVEGLMTLPMLIEPFSPTGRPVRGGATAAPRVRTTAEMTPETPQPVPPRTAGQAGPLRTGGPNTRVLTPEELNQAYQALRVEGGPLQVEALQQALQRGRIGGRVVDPEFPEARWIGSIPRKYAPQTDVPLAEPGTRGAVHLIQPDPQSPSLRAASELWMRGRERSVPVGQHEAPLGRNEDLLPKWEQTQVSVNGRPGLAFGRNRTTGELIVLVHDTGEVVTGAPDAFPEYGQRMAGIRERQQMRQERSRRPQAIEDMTPEQRAEMERPMSQLWTSEGAEARVQEMLSRLFPRQGRLF